MKKLVSILITVLFAVVAIAQDKTIEIPIKSGVSNWGTYADYTTVDTLTSNQDTIDFELEYRMHDRVEKVAYTFALDTIAGADTLSIQLLGYDFENDGTATTLIAADTVNLASASNYVKSYDYATAAKELSYRFYVVRVIRIGTGDGVDLDSFEFKIYN
jgi:hypothetical protein